MALKKKKRLLSSHLRKVSLKPRQNLRTSARKQLMFHNVISCLYEWTNSCGRITPVLGSTTTKLRRTSGLSRCSIWREETFSKSFQTLKMSRVCISWLNTFGARIWSHPKRLQMCPRDSIRRCPWTKSHMLSANTSPNGLRLLKTIAKKARRYLSILESIGRPS